MRMAIKFKKRTISILLAVILFVVAVPSIPALQQADVVKASADWVSELSLTDTDTAKAVYDLLTEPDTGVTLSEGDTYVLEMDIKQNIHTSGNGQLNQNMFALDLLKQSDATTKPAGIEFSNNMVTYWISNGAWNAHVNDSKTNLVIWATATYHYRFTVNAYESIRVEVIDDQQKTVYDGTVLWSKIYGLSNCTADSNTVFKPNLIFTDQQGTVKNISVAYAGETGGTVNSVSAITLTDTDTTTKGTKTVYDLLADANTGLLLNKGCEYVFEMDIKQNVHTAGNGQLNQNMFALDLLKQSDATTKPAGIEFSNNMVTYWVNHGGWNAHVNDNKTSLVLWATATYHYRFTVNAYESIRVEVIDDQQKTVYDGTVSWSKIYGLSNCTADSNTVFKPNLIFTDQQGTVSNVKITYVQKIKAPVMGANDVNLAEGRTLPTTFEGHDNASLDVGKIVTSTEEATWYYSGTFNYSALAEQYGGLNVTFGEGTYNGVRKDLTVTARVHKESGAVVDTQLVLWTGVNGDVLFLDGFEEKYSTGTDYTFTVQVSNGKVSYWMNDTLLIEEFDLTATGVTDTTPKFGLNANGTAGTISNIKIWGDVFRTTVPVMGEEDINMAEGKTLPSTFAGHDNIKLDIGKIVATTDVPTWYYSGSFNYSSFVNGYGGLNVTFGEGIHNGSRKDMTVTARIHKENGVVVDTQIVLWTGVNGDVLYINGSNIKYNTETEYTFSVKVSDNKISFWINDTLFVDAVDLAAKGVTELRPKFGFNANGTAGTIANIKIWGDLASVEAATRPDSVANLALECEQFNSFVPSLKNYYDNDRIHIEDNSWYFSGNFVYESMPDYGGITFVFGEGTYTTAASSNKASITGTREISVTARPGGYAGNVRKTQTVIWVDAEPVHVGEVPGFSYEIGKEYKWTVEVENGLLTFWIDGKLIYDEIDLSTYGITNLQPYFAILPDGSSGKISNVEIWDTTIEEAKPTFTNKDINSAVLSEVKVSATTGRMLYDGIAFTDGGEYYYSADVKEQSEEDNIHLVVAKVGEATVEVYYDGTKVHLIKNSNGQDVEIATNAVSVDASEKCNYVIKYSGGKISVWINNVLALCKVAVEGSTPVAGIGTNGAAGTVTNIKLWGDTSQTGGIVYQNFADISSYRGNTKTYPQANGYVFGGWYQDANEEKPISVETNSGAAYAKMVPEEVLSIKTQVLKDTTYASDKTNLRFITSVDSLQYLDVNITLKSQGKTRKFTGLDVYKTITVVEGEAKIQDSPRKLFCSDSEYLFTVNMKNIDSFDLEWTVVPGWTTFDGTEVAGVETKIAVNDKFNKHITKEELGLNGSTLLQIASSSSSNMMSYVMKTKNNKIIVIDGGNKEDADYLVWVLKNRYQVSKVDAWYVTHEDAAHYGALETVLNNKMITVQKIYYNFLVKSDSAFKQLLEATAGAEEVGQITHQYGDVKVHVINDSQAYASGYEQNAGNADKATMVLLAEFGGTKNTGVLFLGDLTSDTEACIVKQAEDRNIDLKGKVLQMAGHSGSACSKAFYEHLEPTVALWPAVLSTWENSVSLRDFLSKNGVTEHFSSSQNNCEFY